MKSSYPLSVLDLSPVTQGSTPAESFRRSEDIAQHVEKWGYHRYWLAEHHGMPGIASAATSVLIGHIASQTRQSLTNIKAILEAAGLTMDNVVKTTVFLQSMGDFAAMNAVYAEFFTEGQYPARSAVEVGALPRGALVEIETICVK